MTRLPESRSLHTNVIAPSNQARCSRDIKLSAMQTCCNSVSLHLIFPPTDGSLPVFSKGKRMLYFTRLPRITDASFTASSWANHKYFGKYSHTSLPKENTGIPIRLRSTISSTIIILIMWTFKSSHAFLLAGDITLRKFSNQEKGPPLSFDRAWGPSYRSNNTWNMWWRVANCWNSLGRLLMKEHSVKKVVWSSAWPSLPS